MLITFERLTFLCIMLDMMLIWGIHTLQCAVTVGFFNLHMYILILVGFEFSGKMSNCSLFIFLLQVYEKV